MSYKLESYIITIGVVSPTDLNRDRALARTSDLDRKVNVERLARRFDHRMVEHIMARGDCPQAASTIRRVGLLGPGLPGAEQTLAANESALMLMSRSFAGLPVVMGSTTEARLQMWSKYRGTIPEEAGPPFGELNSPRGPTPQAQVVSQRRPPLRPSILDERQ